MKLIKLIILTLFLMIAQAHQVSAAYEEHSATQLVLCLNQSEVESTLDLDHRLIEDLCWQLLVRSFECYLANQYYAFDGIDGVNQCHMNTLIIGELASDSSLRRDIKRAYNHWCRTADKWHILRDIFDDSSTRNKLRIQLQILSLDLLLSTVTGLGGHKKVGIEMLLGIGLSGDLKTQLAKGTSKLIVRAKKILVAHKLNFIAKRCSDLGLEMTPRHNLIHQQVTDLPIYPKYPGMQLFISSTHQQNTPLILKIKTSASTTPYLYAIDPQNWQWLDISSLSTTLQPDTCVVVIDAIATESLSLDHLNPYQALLAIAANFMVTDEDQRGYNNPNNFELQESLRYATEQQLTRTPDTENRTWTYGDLYIEHIYPDSLEHAKATAVHIFDNTNLLTELQANLSILPRPKRLSSDDYMMYVLHETRYMNLL